MLRHLSKTKEAEYYKPVSDGLKEAVVSATPKEVAEIDKIIDSLGKQIDEAGIDEAAKKTIDGFTPFNDSQLGHLSVAISKVS